MDDPRLSGASLKVLKMFLEKPRERYSGAEISKGAGVGAGTLYPLLNRFEQAGWFKSEWEDVDPAEAGRPRRRFYTLTAVGQTKAREAFQSFQIPEGALVWTC